MNKITDASTALPVFAEIFFFFSWNAKISKWSNNKNKIFHEWFQFYCRQTTKTKRKSLTIMHIIGYVFSMYEALTFYFRRKIKVKKGEINSKIFKRNGQQIGCNKFALLISCLVGNQLLHTVKAIGKLCNVLNFFYFILTKAMKNS